MAGGVEQEPPDVGGDVGVHDLDVAGLDGKRIARFLGEPFVDRTGTETTNILGPAVHQSQHRANDVGSIVHGNHAFPVLGPSLHVLRVRSGHVLDFAQFALLVEILDEQELSAVDDGLGHHVLQTGLLDQFDDLLTLLDRGRHGHCTHHVFACLEGLQ